MICECGQVFTFCKITFSVSPSNVWIIVEQQVSVVIWGKIKKVSLNSIIWLVFFNTCALGPPISVRTQPGCIAMTSTPVSARSTDRLWIKVKSLDDVKWWSMIDYVLWFIRDLHWHVESSFGAPVSVKSTSSVFSDACNSRGHLHIIRPFTINIVSKSKYFTNMEQISVWNGYIVQT